MNTRLTARRIAVASFLAIASSSIVHASVAIDTEHVINGLDSSAAWVPMTTLPNPSSTDLAQSATFTVISGDPVGGGITAANDGTPELRGDDPDHSLFFSDEGRGTVLIDLGATRSIGQINTYSWHYNDGEEHKGVRGPQKYVLYGSSSDTAPSTTDPANNAQWSLIASVDSTPTTDIWGGQYAVSIHDTTGSLGSYHYLLWNIDRPSWGATFYGEFDVVAVPEPMTCGLVAASPLLLLRRRPAFTCNHQ